MVGMAHRYTHCCPVRITDHTFCATCLQIAVGMDGELQKRTYTGSKNPRDLVARGTRLWLTARVRNDDYKNKIVLSFQQTEQSEAC